jgi:hypothetical protein
MSSIRKLAAAIGCQAKLRTAEGLRVEVVIDDARKAYGRTDYRVSPLAGDGVCWVSSDRVEVNLHREKKGS